MEGERKGGRERIMEEREKGIWEEEEEGMGERGRWGEHSEKGK